MNQVRKFGISDERALPPFTYFLMWLILMNVTIFAGYTMLRAGYLQKVLDADKSMISIVIVAVFFAASLHVAVHLYRTSRLLLRASDLLDGASVVEAGSALENKLVDDYVVEMNAATKRGKGDGIDQANYIFEIYVDQLRSPLELGSFVVDVLIRLGLIGTIIGFIMMLQSFVTGPSPTEENIQELLITMSTGMGTALYTTFAGLVASTLLGVQHQLLNRNVEGVVASLIRLSDAPNLSRSVKGMSVKGMEDK